jgi:plastocyanin
MIAFKSSFLALAFSTLTVAQYGGGGGSGGASSTATSAAPSATSATTNSVTNVLVGNGGLVFTPNTVQAKVGDTINFHFYPTGHSVAESAFNSPCSYMKGGIWSGSVSSSSGVAVSLSHRSNTFK